MKMIKAESEKIDIPFLEKFNSQSVYFKSSNELYKSIIREIENILSSRLKLTDEYLEVNFKDVPFYYGTRDLESIEISREGLHNFKSHCKKMILACEPRLKDLEFTKIEVNKEKQNLILNIVCYLKKSNGKFTSEIKIST